MTVSSAYVPAISDGDGVSVIFPVPFRFDATTDVRCTIYAVDGTARTPAFVVTGTGDPGGSLQITDGAPLVGEKVVRERVTNLRQPTNYTSGTFPSKAHEDSADRLVMMAQERNAIAGRTLRLGPLSLPIEPIPPVALGRALIRTPEGFGEGPTADEIAAAQANAQAAIDAAVAAAISAGQAATFNPALYALKASAAAITGPWTFSSTVKFGSTGVLHFGAADEANLAYSTGMNVQADTIRLRNKLGTASMLLAVAAGAVSLFFNNVVRLITTATGITVTGAVSADTAAGNWLATQAEAEAGVLDDHIVTPLKVTQAVAFRMNERERVTRVPVASVSAVDISLPAGYRRHKISLYQFLPGTNNVGLAAQLSFNGGATFLATATYGFVYGQASATATIAGVGNNASATSIDLASSVGNGANERGVSGDIEIFDLITSAQMNFQTGYRQGSGTMTARFGHARHPDPGATHVRLLCTAGVIASGAYTIQSFKD